MATLWQQKQQGKQHRNQQAKRRYRAKQQKSENRS
jgi:hypothetical protein